MATVDTSVPGLKLYAGMSANAFNEVECTGLLSPNLVMAPTKEHAWIPLHVDAEAAFRRALWGAEERGETNLHPKHNFRVIRFDFTAHGFGHYYLSGVLTTSNWKQWRFHGDLPLLARASTSGDVLVCSGPDVLAFA